MAPATTALAMASSAVESSLFIASRTPHPVATSAIRNNPPSNVIQRTALCLSLVGNNPGFAYRTSLTAAAFSSADRFSIC